MTSTQMQEQKTPIRPTTGRFASWQRFAVVAAAATMALGLASCRGSDGDSSSAPAVDAASTENYSIGEVNAAGEATAETPIYRIVMLPDGRFLATGDERPGLSRSQQFATQVSDSATEWQAASLAGIPNGYLLEKAVPEPGGYEGYLIPSEELASQPGYSPATAPRLMSKDGLNWSTVNVTQPESPEGVEVVRFITDLGIEEDGTLVALTNTAVIPPNLVELGADVSQMCTIPSQLLSGTTLNVRYGPCWYNPNKDFVEYEVALPPSVDANWVGQTLEFRIYRSTDNGESWTPDEEPFVTLPHRLPDETEFQGALYRLVNDGDDPGGRLEISKDDGATWEVAGFDAASLLPDGDWVFTFGAGDAGLAMRAQRAGVSAETPPSADDVGHVLLAADGSDWRNIGEFTGLSRAPVITVSSSEVLIPAVEKEGDPTWTIERFPSGG